MVVTFVILSFSSSFYPDFEVAFEIHRIIQSRLLVSVFSITRREISSRCCVRFEKSVTYYILVFFLFIISLELETRESEVTDFSVFARFFARKQLQNSRKSRGLSSSAPVSRQPRARGSRGEHSLRRAIRFRASFDRRINASLLPFSTRRSPRGNAS